MKRRHFIFGLTATACLFPACQNAAPQDTTVYLIRHAEKQKGDDPGLTEAGVARTQALVDRLQSKKISHIHSSDYRRTRDTAAPLANTLGLDVNIYDARDLLGIAETIQSQPGVHVVVGHSNTTPELAAILSGQIMDAMSEDEYDRLIEVRLNKDGELIGHKSVRYGAGN